MTTRRIASANAEFQVLHALRTNRQTRNRENAFVVEGVRNIDAALAHGWTVRAALTRMGARRSAWAERVVGASDNVVEVAPELFEQLTDREEPPELLLVAEKRRVGLDDLAVDGRFVGTVLDRPGNPGNIGTILRTTDALGGTALLLMGHGADPYDPRAVRASTGSFFAVPLVEVTGADQLRQWGDSMGVSLIATDEHGGDSLDTMPIGAIALLFGNEAAGLSRALLDTADRTVAIPMHGSASSLNVAAAHAIVLFSATATRRG